MSKLLHSKKVDRDYTEFLEEVQENTLGFIASAHSDRTLRAIYKVCTAGFAVLEGCSAGTDLLLRGASGAIRRCAVLAVMRQVTLTKVELRRLIECSAWYVYFTDHPVEFEEFARHPERGWGAKPETGPIESVCRMNPAWFLKYARERFKTESSGLVAPEVQILENDYVNLSGDVHAAKGSVSPTGTLALSNDRFDNATAENLRAQIQRIVKGCVLLSIAIDPRIVRRLDAINREWLEWILGDAASKSLRISELGIHR